MDPQAPSDPPAWLVPLILVAFPVVFVGIWSLVSLLLSAASGFRRLSAYRVDPAAADTGDELPLALWAMIGFTSYRGGIVELRAGRAGLTVAVSRLFPFHGAVCVPWQRVELPGEPTRSFRGLGGTVMLDAQVRLRLPTETWQAVRGARARWMDAAG
jgi:hypothetical protein